jgi:hypothetical protein
MKSKLLKGIGIAVALLLGAFLYVKCKPAGNNSFFAIKDSLAQAIVAPPQAEDIHAIPSQLPQDYFGQPLHGDLTVSGSFAELRANHFHSGIDFRTEGGEGRPVLASADGYVSRIRIGPYGFGKALYIAHPNGYTTVYGHLKYFNGHIQTYAVNQQYKTESFDQELYLGATILFVKKGDTIAWSGNTGGSGGPHLHFEIRKSSNDQIINPLLFGVKIKDNIDPFIKSVLLVRINDSLYQHYGYFPERISRQAPALKKTKELIHVPTGKYGLALSDVDYFVDFASRLGINYAELFVNDELIFTHKIEHFLFDETKYINSHLDFAFYREKGVRYARMFQTAGNKLKFYSDKNNGIFQVAENDTIRVKTIIKDFAGHTDVLEFRLTGSAKATLPYKSKTEYDQTWKVKANQNNTFSAEGFKIAATPGHFMDNASIGYKTSVGPKGALSPLHSVYGERIPLYKSSSISIKPTISISKPKQYVIIYKDIITGGIAVENGEYSNGWINTTVKNLGSYYVSADSTAPIITPHNWGRNLRFRIADNLSGIESYKLTVDGQWVLMEYDYKNGNLFGSIPKSIGAGKHILNLIVTDKAGNAKKLNQSLNL